MISHATRKFKWYWDGWAKKRNRPGNPQRLNSRNVYILPSAFGWAYGVIVFILFVGAINYQINTLFLLTFLLGTIGLVNAWEAHANLNHLAIQLISIEDAQAGTPAKVTLFIQANHKRRFGIDFQTNSSHKTRLEIIPPEGIQITLPVETTTRGYFQLPPVRLASIFPFGLFSIWSYAYFDAYYYVYPQPVDPGFWPAPYLDQNTRKKDALGDEELFDLRQVENPWDEPNLIAWRIAAKGQGWYLKRMDSNDVDFWLFQLTDSPAPDPELALQHLSYWLQTAENTGAIYDVALTPASQPRLTRGKTHLQHCLRQLALFS